MNIVWHYWCGAKPGVDDRYVRYLLLSVNSLIKIGGVDPQKIYITIDDRMLNSQYGLGVKKLGVNFQLAPPYRNFSKQYGFSKIVKDNPCIDRIVQIDCDTIVSKTKIEEEIALLDSCISINTSDDVNLYDIIVSRNGQPHSTNTIMGMSPKCNNYSVFRDLMRITFNANTDAWLECTTREYIFHGHAYVINPQKLSWDFFRFLSLMNLFFEDDEAGLSFARFHFNLEYGKVNPLNVQKGTFNDSRNLSFIAPNLEQFDKLCGIIHYPQKTDHVHNEMLRRAEEVLKTI